MIEFAETKRLSQAKHMPKFEQEYYDLTDHPAVDAWRRATDTRDIPERIERLFDDAQAKKKNRVKNKSALFRLVKILPNGKNIVAKRSQLPAAETELRIYRDILPHLHISQLQFYGSSADEDSGFHWLFIEDAGSEEYDRNTLHHQLCGATWLAELHGQSSKLLDENSQTSNNLAMVFNYLSEGRMEVQRHVAKQAFSTEQKQLLENILRHYDVIEHHWDQVQDGCRSLPTCLVHADFVPKNIRIRSLSGKKEIYCFDWEVAGWGCPAVDLGCLNADQISIVSEEYWQTIRKFWPHLSMEQVNHGTASGIILRTLMGAYWASTYLSTPYPEKGLSRFFWYDKRLARRLGEFGWA